MTTTTLTAPPGKVLQISLWLVQVLLAAAFVMAGIMKTFTPLDQLIPQMPWVADLPRLTRFIGVSEFLGGLGLVLPSITRIRPVLTPLAALGLTTIMVLAMGFHLVRGEAAAVPFNALLGGLAAFVAWGRYRKAPIAPRG